MLTYNNNRAIKQKYIDRMQAHMDADELIRGVGFEDGRGCAIGCTLGSYDHKAFENEIAPEWVARLIDLWHESTSSEVWPTLCIQILKAIPIGLDLAPLEAKMKVFFLNQSNASVMSVEHLKHSVKYDVVRIINQAITLQEGNFFGSYESAAMSIKKAECLAADSVRQLVTLDRWTRFSVLSALRSANQSAPSLQANSARSVFFAARSAADSMADLDRTTAAFDDQAIYFLKLLSEL